MGLFQNATAAVALTAASLGANAQPSSELESRFDPAAAISTVDPSLRDEMLRTLAASTEAEQDPSKPAQATTQDPQKKEQAAPQDPPSTGQRLGEALRRRGEQPEAQSQSQEQKPAESRPVQSQPVRAPEVQGPVLPPQMGPVAPPPAGSLQQTAEVYGPPAPPLEASPGATTPQPAGLAQAPQQTPQLWRPMTQEQIEALTPEQMVTVISDLEKRVVDSARVARVTQDELTFTQQVNEILVNNRAEGSAAQVRALNSFFSELYKNERAQYAEWQRGLDQVAADRQASLVNGIPGDVAHAINGINANRQELVNTLQGDRNALAEHRAGTYQAYTDQQLQLRESYRNLAGLNVVIPPELVRIFGGNREQSPEEQRKAAEQRERELANEPVFAAFKKIEDPSGRPELKAATTPINVEDAARYIMGPGQGRAMSPGEQRINIIDLQARVASSLQGAELNQLQLAETLKQTQELVAVQPGAQSPVPGMLRELRNARVALSEEAVRLEQRQEELNRPMVTGDQYTLLNTYVQIQSEITQIGWNKREEINALNWQTFDVVNQEMAKYFEGKWAEFRRYEAARNGDIGGVIIGR